jgi:hypothetical protein
MENKIIENAFNILNPVMESGVVFAGMYAKACDRDTITSTDMEYGIKHAALHVLGKIVGSIIQEDEIDNEDEVIDIDEEEESFTCYTGTTNILAIQMNESYDKWAEWEPTSPMESMIKSAVNQNFV